MLRNNKARACGLCCQWCSCSGAGQRHHPVVDEAGLAEIRRHQDHQLLALVGGRFQGGGIDDVDGVGPKTGLVEALAGLGHQEGR